MDANTAVMLNENGIGTVVGSGLAYFFAAPDEPAVCKPGAPLTYTTVSAYKIWGGINGNWVNFDTSWRASGGSRLLVTVEAGKMYINGIQWMPPAE